MLRYLLRLVGPSLLAACAGDAVEWGEVQRAPEGTEVSPAASATLLTAPAGARCDLSLVSARGRGDTTFAAWWSPRADSNAVLLVARSDDGGRSWRHAEVADSTDQGRTGCGRPAPQLFADSANGYVHVVYFLQAREGPGIFFTHSMTGGTMFHAPVPVVYGARPAAASVAAHGDTVVVAFEDPNSAAPQVWLALSATTGHIFERRTNVTSVNASATRPAIVLDGAAAVTVLWTETPRDGGASARLQRSGVVRW